MRLWTINDDSLKLKANDDDCNANIYDDSCERGGKMMILSLRGSLAPDGKEVRAGEATCKEGW